MRVCGLKSVLAVTILGLIVACNSDYGVQLEPARLAHGVDPEAQEGMGDQDEMANFSVVFHNQPLLKSPIRDVHVGAQQSDQSAGAQQSDRAAEELQVDEDELQAGEDQSAAGEGTLVEGDHQTVPAEQSPIQHRPPHQNKVVVTDIENWETLALPEQLEALLARATLDCSLNSEIKAYCQSTALVLSLDRDQNGETLPLECTGHYIGNNTVLTAAHCVPQEVLDGEASCTDRIAFGFYQEGSTELLPASCLAVTEHFRHYTESEDQRAPDLRKSDVAFLQVQFDENQGRAIRENALTLSREGFVTENDFFFVSITPFPGGKQGGVIEFKECRAYENTVILDGHRDYRSEAVVLMGESCQAPPGNSGAVVISGETGRVVGAVHAYLDEAKEKYEELGYRVSEEGLLNPVIATNFACLNSEVVEVSSPMSGCESVSRVEAQKRRNHWMQVASEYDLAVQSSAQEAQAILETSAVEISDLLEVSFSRQNPSSVVTPLRAVSETLVPNFRCHLQQAGSRSFSFNAAQREAFQYLDKTLVIKTGKNVQPVARSYQVQPASEAYLRITESGTAQSTDLPRCN